MDDNGIDFYENNEDATIAVFGMDDVVAVYDGRSNEGVVCTSREEAEYIVEALGRWLNEGGK